MAATFDSATTTGNVIIVKVAIDKSSSTITTPSGFTSILSYSSTSVSGAMSYKISDGTETTITYTTVTARIFQMCIEEWTSVGAFDVSATANSGGTSVTSQTSGTTATTANANSIAFAFFGSDSRGGTDAGVAYTNSFVTDSVDPGGGSGAGNAGYYAANKTLTSTGAQTTTFSTTGGGDQMFGVIAVFADTGGGGGGGVNGNRMPLRMRNPFKGIIG
jgi:hypothetical protein